MIDILENHSGKIGLALGCCALVGGGVLLGFVPGGAVFVAAYGSHIFVAVTAATAVGAVASGASYLRREHAHREARERDLNQLEQTERTAVESALNIVSENQRNAPNLNTSRQSSSLGSIDELKLRIDSLEAKDNTMTVRLQRMERLYADLSKRLARQAVDEERRAYTESENEEVNPPLLPQYNMFVTQPRIPLEIVGHEEKKRCVKDLL